METVYGSIAGIDVHKKMLAVVIRRQSGEQVEYEKRKFGTTHADIQHLAVWLQAHGVSEVVMESTARYWRPVWNGLEPHFRLHLTHPLKTQAPRGQKWDFRDAQRLADRWSAGDLEESFIPGSEQRAWRQLTRARVQLKKKLSVVHSHVEGLLEHGGIKLSAVVSDLFGVSGWAMLEGIAQGVTEVEVLAGEARGALRKKITELKEALVGGWSQPTGCYCGSTWIKCGCCGARLKKSTRL
jgi:transposase